MKIRLFGRELFEFHAKGGDLYAVPAMNAVRESKYLPDFRLLNNDGKAKQWVFAERTIEYMTGWQNILDAMKYAITEAEKKLEKHQKGRQREVERKEVDLMRAIAAEGKKNR